MGFRLKSDESVRRGLRRLARKEIRSAADALRRNKNKDAAIHDARSSLKKAREILRIFRNDDGRGLGKHQRRLRNASRSLSALRDAGVRVEVFDDLHRRAPKAISKHAFTVVRRELVNDKKQAMNRGDVKKTFADVARTLDVAERSATRWRSRAQAVSGARPSRRGCATRRPVGDATGAGAAPCG